MEDILKKRIFNVIILLALSLACSSVSVFSPTDADILPVTEQPNPEKQTPQYKETISLSDGNIRDWELSPDNKHFVVSTSQSVILINLSNPGKKEHLQRGNFSEVSFSPDGKWLAFLEIPKRDQDGSYSGDEKIYLVALPDGEIISVERDCDDGGYLGGMYCTHSQETGDTVCYEDETRSNLLCEGEQCDSFIYDSCDADYFPMLNVPNIGFTTDGNKLVYRAETGYTYYDLSAQSYEFSKEFDLVTDIYFPSVSGNEYQNQENIELPDSCILQQNSVIRIQICDTRGGSDFSETSFTFTSLIDNMEIGKTVLTSIKNISENPFFYRDNLFFIQNPDGGLRIGLIDTQGLTIFGLGEEDEIRVENREKYLSLIDASKCLGQGLDEETLDNLNQIGLILSPDQTKLFVIGSNEIKMISLAQDGEETMTINPAQYVSIGFSPSGEFMAIYYYDCQTRPLGVELRKTSNFEFIKHLAEFRKLGKSPLENLYPGYLEIYAAQNRGDFSSDSSKVAVSYYDNNVPIVGIFSASDGSFIAKFELPKDCDFYSWVSLETIALGCETESLQAEVPEGYKVVDADTGESIYTLICSYYGSAILTQTGFSPMGDFFVCNDEIEHETSIVRLQDNEKVFLEPFTNSVYDRMRFSLDGKLLTIETREQLSIYKLPEWKKIEFDEYLIYEGLAEISPDGKILALAIGGGYLDIYELPTGILMGSMYGFHNGSILDLEFSQDSNFIASFSRDGTIVVQPVNPK